MRHIRNLDRHLHRETYPELYYPQVYLLEGGYKQFFHEQPDYCEPRSYTPMANNENECARSFKSLRASWREFGDKKKRGNVLRRSAPS